MWVVFLSIFQQLHLRRVVDRVHRRCGRVCLGIIGVDFVALRHSSARSEWFASLILVYVTSPASSEASMHRSYFSVFAMSKKYMLIYYE